MAELKKAAQLQARLQERPAVRPDQLRLGNLTAGRSPWTWPVKADWSSLQKVAEAERPRRDYVERTLPPRDRLAGVYYAATEHDEDQPLHQHVLDTSICIGKCAEEYLTLCTRFPRGRL
jgi:electron-transferring-flavoprotein dehydrogenase